MGKAMALLAIFLSYYIATTAFYHIHTNCNGFISHSHPYIPTEGDRPYAPAHTHTDDQCESIDLLDEIVAAVVAVFYVSSERIGRRVFRERYGRKIWKAALILRRLRAPPAC